MNKSIKKTSTPGIEESSAAQTHETLDLLPDLYARNSLISKFINLVRTGDDPIKILDVGGRSGQLEKFLFPNDDYVILDIRESELSEKNYVIGDIYNSNFKEKMFDIVVSSDLYEHLESSRRIQALSEMLRLSKNYVILGAPFNDPEIMRVELEANNIFYKLLQKNNPWLEEHMKNGLPDRNELELFLKKNNYDFISLENGNLSNWLLLEIFISYVYTNGISQERFKKILKFYNQNLESMGHYQKPCYRRIYLIGKAGTISSTKLLERELDKKPDSQKKNQFISMIFNLLTEINSEKNIHIRNLEAMRANDEALLEQIKNRVKELEVVSSSQEKQIEDMQKKATQVTRTVAELETTNDIQNDKINSLEEKLQSSNARESLLNDALDAIHRSLLFNLTRRMALFLDKTFPPNTLLGQTLRKTAYRFYGKESNTSALSMVPVEPSSGYEFDDFIDEKTQAIMVESFDKKPTISIIMPVYNTEPILLKKAILSVKKQYYSNWQMCICDDGSSNDEIRKILETESSTDNRILVTYSNKNEGISSASNKALILARGEYTLLLDHDDELARNALLEIVNVISKHKNTDFIYSDEDKIDQQGKHSDPFFKPDWSPDLLFSYNYTIHVSVFRTSLLKEIGGFRIGFEGSQDYDLNLRYLEHSQKIVHIPKVLYSWRKIPGSTALNLSEKSYAFKAGKKAINEALQRRGIDAECEDGIQLGTYGVKYSIKEKPLVTIIIPTRTLSNLKKCVESIIEKSTYKNSEIIVMDSSKDSQIKKFCEHVSQVRYENIHMQKFNFSKVNNYAVQKSNGKYVIFLNDDTGVITPEWIEKLLEHAQRNEIGVVGSKLLYPDNRVQHAGTVIGIQYHAGNYGNMYKDDGGYFSYAKIIRNCSAVTAACMMMKKDFFNKIGGYDERLAKSWQDVDLCIRVINSGKLIVYTPYSVLYHYEGGTRGAVDATGEELEARRLFREKNLNFIEKGDPYYNPNLSLVVPFKVVKNYIKPIRVLADLYELRLDLRQSFPNEPENGFKILIDWAATLGILTDIRSDILKKYHDYYFDNSSTGAKPLATIVKQYVENKELQKKFPEAAKGNLEPLLKFMNAN